MQLGLTAKSKSNAPAQITWFGSAHFQDVIRLRLAAWMLAFGKPQHPTFINRPILGSGRNLHLPPMLCIAKGIAILDGLPVGKKRFCMRAQVHCIPQLAGYLANLHPANGLASPTAPFRRERSACVQTKTREQLHAVPSCVLLQGLGSVAGGACGLRHGRRSLGLRAPSRKLRKFRSRAKRRGGASLGLGLVLPVVLRRKMRRIRMIPRSTRSLRSGSISGGFGSALALGLGALAAAISSAVRKCGFACKKRPHCRPSPMSASGASKELR